MFDLQIFLTVLLIVIELIAFAWLIIDIRKSKKKQDQIISAAEDSKEILLNALTKNSKNLDKKLQGISVEKLIKNNPTMTLMFKDHQEDREIIKS